MQLEQAERYLSAKPEVNLDSPFGHDIKLFKGASKQFWVNWKCDPNEVLMLRDIFKSVRAGYHMNKAHWNSTILDGSILQGELGRMMGKSYMLVISKMTKKDQQQILVHLWFLHIHKKAIFDVFTM